MKNVNLLFLLFGLLLTQSAFGQKPPESEQEFEAAYQKRIKKERLNGVYIPKDIPDALIELNRLVDASSKAKFKQMTEEAATKKLFFSFGRWITHNWGFYGGSRLSSHLAQFGVTYPDDMARLIILSFHRSLNKRPIQFKQEVEKMKNARLEAYEKERRSGEVIKTYKVAKDSTENN
ncbi:MAG: DUF6794 domain-containing protein [Bacteroidota bacterium]